MRKEILTGSAFIILSLAVIVSGLYYENENIKAKSRDCEDRGGILLDHTRTVGKSVNHAYICIDPVALK